MKSIICGANGFLGSHLQAYFKSRGKEIVILPVEMLLDIAGMHELLKSHEQYHLYYLAAYGNLHGQSDIHEIYQACVIKLLNLLTATIGTQCEAFITTGTTSEYGNKDKPMKESMLLDPETLYGAAKCAATHLARVWAKRMGTPVVIYRPASMIGVGEQSIHLIPTLIRSCLFKESIPFISECVHDYINVDDVCAALEILADQAENIKGEIFNVGSGKQYTNREIKEMIEAITGNMATINKAEKLNPLNVSNVWIANSRKLRKLGWKPKIGVYDTLKTMIKAI
jgi:nucleoside-diphosphate-sugar epimerase